MIILRPFCSPTPAKEGRIGVAPSPKVRGGMKSISLSVKDKLSEGKKSKEELMGLRSVQNVDPDENRGGGVEAIADCRTSKCQKRPMARSEAHKRAWYVRNVYWRSVLFGGRTARWMCGSKCTMFVRQ